VNNDEIPPEEKYFDNDINTIFAEDKDKFIGEFVSEHYKVTRGYTNGNGRQLRLYYTKMEPTTTNKIATICIVHGFGEHSSRFLDMAEAFVKRSFVVHLIDLRGFGYKCLIFSFFIKKIRLLDILVAREVVQLLRSCIWMWRFY